VQAGLRYGNLMAIDHLEDVSVDGRIILKWIFKEWHGYVRARLVWLRTERGGGCMRMW
jgi:hypothetical protein